MVASASATALATFTPTASARRDSRVEPRVFKGNSFLGDAAIGRSLHVAQ